MSDSYPRKCSTMQHGNSSFFSLNGFPPRCQMTLPIRARATVMSTCFHHAGAMENVTYTRTIPNCIASSGVHLSSPIRLLQGLRDGFAGTFLFFFFLVTRRNNCLDAQTVISPRDKVHLSAFNRKQLAGFF